MLLSTLFSLPAELCLVDVRLEHEGLTLVLRSSQTNAACPECGQPSTHVHGHYILLIRVCMCEESSNQFKPLLKLGNESLSR